MVTMVTDSQSILHMQMEVQDTNCQTTRHVVTPAEKQWHAHHRWQLVKPAKLCFVANQRLL